MEQDKINHCPVAEKNNKTIDTTASPLSINLTIPNKTLDTECPKNCDGPIEVTKERKNWLSRKILGNEITISYCPLNR